MKPFTLFTIIKHKNVFFIWPQESPKVVRESLEFSCWVLQTVCPGEKCWGKCIPFSPALVGLIRALFCSVGAERATPATQRHIIALVKGLREDFGEYACKPFGGWVIVVTISIGWERSPTKGKNTDAHRLKHGRVGRGDVMWSSVCWSANGALNTVFDWGGNTPQHLEDAPHSQARLTGGRGRNGCKISVIKQRMNRS